MSKIHATILYFNIYSELFLYLISSFLYPWNVFWPPVVKALCKLGFLRCYMNKVVIIIKTGPDEVKGIWGVFQKGGSTNSESE